VPVHSDIETEIETLLEAERNALLLGDFAALSDLLARKQALVAELAASGVGASALRRLRAMAERNATLLEASMRGLRGASRRLSEIRRANGPLYTYGQDGAQQTLGTPAGSFERRA
jgi:flagellar biosynthesis/type III secretory pathway chaperone